MAQIFSKWTLKLPLYAALAVIILSGSGVGFFWYYGSPQYTDVGYRPVQPVQYSHKLHAGDLGMDCRYCHTGVE
ncbi:MAG: cytochrome c3 family protein, partial [Candidatus Zixiibacteriota bacterium]